MNKLPIKFSFVCLLLLATLCKGQDINRIEALRGRLESLAFDVPNLNNKISVSVSGVSLYEFVRGVAIENKINLNIDPALDTVVSINFNNVTIVDLLSYISNQYQCEVVTAGSNILSIIKYKQPKQEPIPIALKVPDITLNSSTRLISFDLKNDTLNAVSKRITQLTGLNIIVSQKLHGTLMSGYIQNMPIKKGIAEIAHINNLNFIERDSTTIYIEDPLKTISQDTKPQQANLSGVKISTNNRDSILNIQANNIPIKDVLSIVATRLSINYFILSEIKGNVDVKIENTDFSTFIKYIFNGTDYTCRYSNGIYLIGDRRSENIRVSEVYKFMYRTTNKILEIIPPDLKKSVDIIPLVDLNSLILSGSAPAVNELELFLRQIDKSVPVINIELIILDISKSNNITTGISAGISNKATSSTYSSIFPSVDINLGASAINSIITAINGTGLVNLGKVNSNFYVSLQASEESGLINIHSSPRLSTLNGTEAQMAIGETRYYAESTSNIIATQSTTTVSSTVYKPLQANLSITIKPIVSGDEQITLDITLDQASFTNQIATNGPFGQTTRTFKSSIRVRNNDMILLGGLEQRNNSNTGKGFPFLSRIPVIKWLFSSRSSKRSKGKLAILIHPTVIY